MNIKLENIEKIYNRKTDFAVEALKDVSLTINQGDYIGPYGGFGFGKIHPAEHYRLP